MRNLKKFLALVLAMLMVVSAAATVSAFDDVAADHQYVEAINDLAGKKIVKGMDEENTIFAPEGTVTRKQAAIMIARAITGIVDDDAYWQKGGLTTFTDVVDYKNAIATVAMKGIINGWTNLEGQLVFDPEGLIQYGQALKMVVCALGYEVDAIDGAAWWLPYANKALELGLTANLEDVATAETALNRGQFAQLISNMLYATPADGGDCYASKYFDLKTATNATTFAVTATVKQCATETIDVAEGGYVGLQEIVNDVPSGDVVYVEIAALGIASDAEAEDYFLRAVDLINYNAEDNTFGAYEFVGTVEKIYSTEITEGSKYFTYGGKNYYPVEGNTKTPIRNEVVVFNVDNTTYVHTEKILAADRNGIVWQNGVEVLKEVYYSNDPDSVYYYEYATGKVITEAVALALYGEEILSDVPSFKFLDAATLDASAAYELTIYDDDEDGYMDRAYYTPVYLNAHEASLSSSKLKYGPMYTANKANTTFVDVDGNAVTLADGQVYKYTYNEQLNKVTVLATYGVETGVLTRINTINDYSSKNYAVELTIDGEVYTMANEEREARDLLGFQISKVGSITTYDNTIASISGIAASAGSKIGYTYHNNDEFDDLIAGSLVRFIAVDGNILIIETYNIEDSYELAIVNEVTNFDDEAIYMDLWMGGKLVEDVAIGKIYDELTGKYINVSDYAANPFKLSTLLTNVQYIKGNIYRIVPTTGGMYQMSAPLTSDEAWGISEYINASYKVTYHPTAGAAYKLASVDVTGTIVFNDGIADTKKDGSAVMNRRNLIANDATVFYFINEATGVITSYTGVPKDGSSIDLNNAKVLTNKLGFATGMTTSTATATYPINDLAGAANIVVVYYSNSTAITGFGVTSVGEKLVYVSAAKGGNYVHDELIRPRQYADATLYGLDVYAGTNLYWYAGSNLAIDMETGAAITNIYSDEKLDFGKFYILSYDNVVLSEQGDDDFTYHVSTANVMKADVVQARYWRIKDVNDKVVIGDNDKVTKIVIVDANITNYTANTAEKVATAGNTISYIDNMEDGSFVAVVGAPYVPSDDGDATVTYNADYVIPAGTFVAGWTVTEKTATSATVKVTLVKKPTSGIAWDTIVTAEHVSFEGLTGVVTGLGATADAGANTGVASVDANGDLIITITNPRTTYADNTDLVTGAQGCVVNLSNGARLTLLGFSL